MGRRTLLLLAALVVAALGTGLVFLYVNNLEDKVTEGQTLVEVLTASDPIAAGTSGSDAAASGAFEKVAVPRKLVPEGAISDPADIADEVALAPIFEGQTILTQMFGQPSETSALSLPKGAMAVAVQLGDPERVAGFVAPGSSVAVFVTLADADGDQRTQLLLQRATVIAVGPTTVTTTTTTDETGDENTEEISRAILTLALSQKDTQKLIFSQTQGALYFALLNDESEVGPGSATNNGNLFSR